MADTIINTPGTTTDSAVGWVIAAIVVLALAIGAFALFRNSGTTPNTIIQTSIPNTGVTPATGGTGATNGSGSTGSTGSTGGTTGGTTGY